MTQEQLTEILNKHKLWLKGLGDEKANLTRANLHRADLREADLSGADLTRANLHRADLTIAILYGADLYGADLYGANLRGANLLGANLTGAKGIMQFGPMPTSGRMIYFVQNESAIMVQTGCFWGTIDELEQAVKKKHNCPMYLAIIALVREQWKPINNQ